MTFLYVLGVAILALGCVARYRMRRDPAGAGRRVMRGRWISRPALRALGPLRALLARLVLAVAVAVVWVSWLLMALLGNPSAVGRLWLALAVAESLWDVDDWLTGDDDDRRRKPLEWARVRLEAALRPLGYSTSTGRA